MKFVEEVEKLQNAKENEGYLIFVRCGIFYTTIGKDAVIVMKNKNYKLVCAKEKVCKIGIPVSAFEKYLRELIAQDISFVVYDYQKENKKIEEITRVEGNSVFETEKNISCKNCWYKNNRIANSIKESLKIIENLQKFI